MARTEDRFRREFYYEIEGDKGIDIKEIARDFKLSFD